MLIRPYILNTKYESFFFHFIHAQRSFEHPSKGGQMFQVRSIKISLKNQGLFPRLSKNLNL